MDKLERLRGVSFHWTATGKPDIGLIAEGAAAVVPEVVAFESGSGDAKGIDYSRLTALLVEAVKEQHRAITELNQKLEKLMQQPSR